MFIATGGADFEWNQVSRETSGQPRGKLTVVAGAAASIISGTEFHFSLCPSRLSSAVSEFSKPKHETRCRHQPAAAEGSRMRLWA